MLYLDTEGCGLHGPTVLIQYAEDDGDTILYEPWYNTIDDTLSLLEHFCTKVVCAFNLPFDWFHICQLGTTLMELRKRFGGSVQPIDRIEDYAMCEPDARDGPCFKPVGAFDLMLHAQRGEYQSIMKRKPIRIKKVPRELAEPLVRLLDKNIKIPNIYFARKKNRGETDWSINPVDNDFVTLELKFHPSTALKALAEEVFKYKPTVFSDIEVDHKLRPIEVGYAPFALAMSNPQKKWKAKIKKSNGWKRGYAWPGVIQYHIAHWRYNKRAREYAADDVALLKKFYKHFNTPEVNDDDSILACMVGAVRWRGYAINKEGVTELKKQARVRSIQAPKAPNAVLKYIKPYLSQAEIDKMIDSKTGKVSTKKVVLEDMKKWKKTCPHCISQFSVMDMLASKEQETDCEYCKGTTYLNEAHPVANVAAACLDARLATKEIELYDKLLQAGRFHASFKVIGTFSSRMSGTDGLNPQGINHSKFVRKQFPLSHGRLVLQGGDFSAFEVSIADAICDDPKLRDALRTCAECKGLWPIELIASQVECPHCGKVDDEGKPCRQKFHGIFGQSLEPDYTYDQILATKGSANDLYDKGKRGGFSQFYGGNYHTLMTRLGISEEIAIRAEKWFNNEYQGVGKYRERIKEDFCSMRQEGGLGTKVEWHDPKLYVESLTGFRRDFTLETMITKEILKISTNIPDGWKELDKMVVRNQMKGPQKLFGAVMSACIAAAFNIQSAVMRAAANHVIQSTGAVLTKNLQRRLWELQPDGIHEWRIQPMNIHDEIMCPSLPELKPLVKQIIEEFVTEFRKLVPLLAIDWSYDMETWADK